MNEKILEIVKKPWVIPTSVGVASFGIGAAVGYLVANYRNQKEIVAEYEQLTFDLDQDTEAIEKLNRDLETALDGYPPLEEAIDSIEETTMDGETTIVVNKANDPAKIVVQEPETVNIFEQGDSPTAPDGNGWDYESEVARRSSTDIYILHSDEFHGQETPFQQTTLTYYAGDDILTDEHDVPIYNYQAVTGELKFGHGTNDPDVVHIRNETLGAEYEILRNPGRYEVEVLGYEVEAEYNQADLKHSKHHIDRFYQE